MRTIIVADIHGCHSELLALLKKLKFREDTDRLICLGEIRFMRYLIMSGR